MIVKIYLKLSVYMTHRVIDMWWTVTEDSVLNRGYSNIYYKIIAQSHTEFRSTGNSICTSLLTQAEIMYLAVAT